MNVLLPLRSAVALTGLSLLLLGCDAGGSSSSNSLTSGLSDSSSESSGGRAPNISGSWSGNYAVYNGTDPFDGRSVSATVQQSGDAVVITTNLPAQGRMLTGTIDSDGDMRLTDALDGETWTTHFGPATSTAMRIADFLEVPSALNPDPPIAVLNLSR